MGIRYKDKDGNIVDLVPSQINDVTSSSDTTYSSEKIEAIIPTKISDLDNDSGFITDGEVITTINVNGSSYTPTSGEVNLPNYPTSLPASDVYNWAKASTKPTYTASEVGLGNVGNFKAVSTVANQDLSSTEQSNARANIGAGTSNFSGSYSDLTNKPTLGSAAGKDVPSSGNATSSQVVMGNDTRLNDARTPTSHTHSKSEITDFPSSLPASNTTDTYSATGTVPVSGKAVAAALGTLDVASVGGSGKYIQSISETDGKISATAADMPTSLPASDVSAWAKESTKPSYTASEVGAIATTAKGVANGVAELDSAGKVPSSQLPSYVDDVLEYDAKSSFPTTGEAGKIYVDKTTNLTWRWGGTAYTEISPSLALGTTSTTAYRGDYGNTAYAHATDNARLTTAESSGLYKIATTAQGHIKSVTAVVKGDITALGIPAQDTTYSVATKTENGLMSSTDKTKLDGIETGAEANVQADWSEGSSTADSYIKNKPTLGTAATKDIPTSGNASTSQVVMGNDTRLSDSRTPTAHNQASNTINAMTSYSKPSSTSAITTSDTLNSAIGKLEKALDGKGTSNFSGSYADLTNKPTLGTAAAKDIPTSGNATSSQIVMGNDTRLSDSRTPTAHNQASSTINAMTGYSKPSSTSAIETTDTLNQAVGKLEKKLDSVAAIDDTTVSSTSTFSSQRIVHLLDVVTKTFADCDDSDFRDFIRMADLGQINPSNYWAVGDEREVDIGDIPAYIVDSKTIANAVDAHTQTVVIVDTNENRSIMDRNGHAVNFVIAFKTVLMKSGSTAEGVAWDTTNNNRVCWADSLCRTWLGSYLFNYFESVLFHQTLKEFRVRYVDSNGNATICYDYMSLPGIGELGIEVPTSYYDYSYSTFKYYEVSANVKATMTRAYYAASSTSATKIAKVNISSGNLSISSVNNSSTNYLAPIFCV